MRRTFFHSLIFIFLTFIGCTFEPDGDHFIELHEQGVVPEIGVDLNFATDTIYVQKSEWIRFSYSNNGDQVNWAQLVIDGEETAINDTPSGGLELRWYLEGKSKTVFPLELRLFTKSQTGSIADKLGAEGFLISKTWTLVVRNPDMMGVRMKKAELTDGTLKLTWDMFKGTDFKEYRIYREIDYYQQSFVQVATITAQEQTSFIDQNYHGERSRYWVVVNGQFYGPSVSVEGPLPELKAVNLTNGDIQLSWKKPPFYKNLKGYRIAYRNDTGSIEPIGEITDTGIESFTIPNPKFAFSYEFYLVMIPKSESYYDDWALNQFLSTRAGSTYGKITPIFTQAYAGSEPVSFLLNNYQRIIAFDHRSFAPLREFGYGVNISWFDVSSNNHYLVCKLNTPATIVLEDLVNSTNTKKLNLSSTFPEMGHIASVSDQGTGIVLNGQTAVLFDYVHEQKIAEITLQFNNLFANKISASGNFFFCETNAYEYFRYKDQQIVRLPDFNPDKDYVLHADYLPGQQEKLIQSFSNRVEMIDCNTWHVEKQWTFSEPITEVYNLDMKNGQLFYRQGNQLRLLNVFTGNREDLCTTGESYYLNKWMLFYNHGQILWGQGRGIDVTGTNN